MASQEDLEGLKRVWFPDNLMARIHIQNIWNNHPLLLFITEIILLFLLFLSTGNLAIEAGKLDAVKDAVFIGGTMLGLESLNKKLKRRQISGNPGHCELCSIQFGVEFLEIVIARIIDLRLDGTSNDLASFNVHDVSNGLLVCSNCHVLFDKAAWEDETKGGRCLQIDRTGEMHIFGRAAKVPAHVARYHGKFVPWRHLIDTDKYYPRSALLEFAMQERDREPACPYKRVLEQLEEDCECAYES